MNILYLIPSMSNSGGMERILSEKVNHLSIDDNYKIFIITTEDAEKPIFFKLNENVILTEFGLDFNKFYNCNIILKLLETKKLLKEYKRRLEQFIKKNRIDICISMGGKELEFFSDLNSNCKKICELHFSQDIRKQFLQSRSSSVIWNFIGYYRTKQLISQTKNLDRLVVLTKVDLKHWQKTNQNVVQIYNFSSIVPSGVAELNNETVIAVGRLDPQKGFDLLIDAWKILKQKSKNNWILNIFGEGFEKNNLQKKIIENNLQDSLFLKGNSQSIEQEILSSSIFVLSSRYEGFPMVLLESLACGVPIVAFDCKTGPSEIIDNNDCGYLIEYENQNQMAEKIIKLIEDDSERIEKGKVAKEKSEHFSKQVIMNQWKNLFNDLLNR